MTSRLNPYLTFDGKAGEAMDFYRSVFGGDLRTTTFAEFGTDGPGGDRIMHAHVETEHGFVLMASDTMPGMELTSGNSITVSLSGDDADLRRYWQA
jgi:PhnB protein